MNLIQRAITPLEIMLLSLPQPHPTNATSLFVLGLLLFSNVCFFFQVLNKQRNLSLGQGLGAVLEKLTTRPFSNQLSLLRFSVVHCPAESPAGGQAPSHLSGPQGNLPPK